MQETVGRSTINTNIQILDPCSFSEVLTVMGGIHMGGDTLPYPSCLKDRSSLAPKKTFSGRLH